MTRKANPELINEIEQITINEIIKNGINSISMRKIAKKAGITPTTIYYYFKNKKALFEKIKYNAFTKVNDYVLFKINKTDNYTKQLKDLMTYFIEWILKNKNIAEIIFDKLPPQLEMSEKIFEHYSKINLTAIDILKKGKDNNEFDFKSAEVESTIGFALIYGTVKLYFNKRILPEFWDNIDILINRLIDIIFLAIKTKE
jgi:AcrR family transcriptional regulator